MKREKPETLSRERKSVSAKKQNIAKNKIKIKIKWTKLNNSYVEASRLILTWRDVKCLDCPYMFLNFTLEINN